MTQPLDHRHHLKSLDGIRGLAITMVFFHHYYPRNIHNPIGLLAGFGWMGVDLFFTLSGFLITGILYDTASQTHFFKNFYMRRALRLLPVYFAVVAVVFCVSWIHGERPTWWAVPFFLYGSNIVINLHLPIGVAQHVQVGHFWSLALEEQFYFLWPPIVLLLRSRRKIMVACVAGSAFSVLLRFLVVLTPLGSFFPFVPYNSLLTRCDSLLLGGLLAMIVRGEKGIAILKPFHLRLGTIAGLLAIMACAADAHTSYYISRPMVLAGYLAAAVAFSSAIGLSLLPGTLMHRIGRWTPLRHLGRYSYGLYLWHLLPQQSLEWLPPKCESLIPIPFVGGSLGFALLFAIAILAAMLSYHIIELPCLRLKRYFSYDDEHATHRVHIDQASMLRTDSLV